MKHSFAGLSFTGRVFTVKLQALLHMRKAPSQMLRSARQYAALPPVSSAATTRQRPCACTSAC